MMELVIIGIVSFIGTNIDDIFINTLLYSQAGIRKERQQVTAGVYLGMGILVILSISGAAGIQTLPVEWVRWLGLLPILLGIRASWEAFHSEPDENPLVLRSRNLLTCTAIITIVNGADNLGVYIPLFAGFSSGQLAAVCMVYVVMVALLCWMAYKLSELPAISDALAKYRHIIVPVVFLGLGLYILL